MKKNMSNYN